MAVGSLENLPVELIADAMGELDLRSLTTVAYLSRRLRQIAESESLNPWRRPILRNLLSGSYEDCLRHLSLRSVVPRTNFIEILSIARPEFLLFEASLPNLKEAEWEESFRRRFLPGWEKWKKEGTWRAAFLKVLQRVWHRNNATCTADEAWTKYIILNRRGTANQHDGTSRNFDPLAIFDEMKLHSNLAHLETRVRLVLRLADVRILALGLLSKPHNFFSVNTNASLFLHPVGADSDDAQAAGYYSCLTHPLPAISHRNYPYKTDAGDDERELLAQEEEGLVYVGGFMLVAQLTSAPMNQDIPDFDLRHSQYASFTWPDFWAIAPWMRDKITKCIDGPGLGL